MLPTPSPSRLLRRLLGNADEARDAPSIEPERPVSTEGSRAEQARREARHWLAMREEEFTRRIRERESVTHGSGRAS